MFYEMLSDISILVLVNDKFINISYLVINFSFSSKSDFIFSWFELIGFMNPCKDYQALLQSYKKEQNAPYECPNCNKFFKSYVGIEYHLNNVCNSSKHTSTPPRNHLSVTGSSRKSRPRSLKKRKTARARSTSPFDLNPPIHETLTWAEAQRLVVVEYEGSQVR